MRFPCITVLLINIIRRYPVLFVLACMLYTASAQQGNSRRYEGRLVDWDTSSSGFFEENIGQVRDMEGNSCEDIHFMASRRNVRIYLRRQGLSFVFARPAASVSPSRPAPIDATSPAEVPSSGLDLYRLDLQLIGANPNVMIVPGERAPGYSTYYLPHRTTSGARARQYGSVIYRDIYPGIDMMAARLAAGLKYECSHQADTIACSRRPRKH